MPSFSWLSDTFPPTNAPDVQPLLSCPPCLTFKLAGDPASQGSSTPAARRYIVSSTEVLPFSLDKGEGLK